MRKTSTIRKVYFCECGGETLVISASRDKFWHENKTLDLAFFEYGKHRDNRFGFIQRCKSIWKIIKEGSPYNDCIILDKKEAVKMANDIKSIMEGVIE